MILGYDRLDHLVAVSAIKKAGLRKGLVVPSCSLVVSYANYVRSQVHLNVSSDLYDRPLSTYVKALRFINGESFHIDSALEALKFFYGDMARFLINNGENIVLTPMVDCPLGLAQHHYRMASVKDEILSLFRESSVAKIHDSEYSEIIDCIGGVEGGGVYDEVCRKLDSYAMAAVFKREERLGCNAVIVIDK